MHVLLENKNKKKTTFDFEKNAFQYNLVRKTIRQTYWHESEITEEETIARNYAPLQE